MVHHVKDLSPDQPIALEGLLGRTLRADESLTIRPAVVLKDAPVGEEHLRLARQYLRHLDILAERVKDVPDEELDAVIQEAFTETRHRSK